MSFDPEQFLQECYSNQQPENYRAAAAPSLDADAYNKASSYSTHAPSKETGLKLDTTTTACSDQLWEVHDESFLGLHVFVNDDASADDVYNCARDAVIDASNGFQNFREFPGQKSICGWYFDESRSGCFRIELFKHEEKLGINCSRLEGESLAVTQLWKIVKSHLLNEGHYTDEEEMSMAETDDEGFFSDEEGDFDFDMDMFKYLNFSRDPAFIERLINEIEDINVGAHSLMLLAFNCESQSNLDFLAENYGQQVFNKILLRLAQAEGTNVTLPVARCAANIIQHMVQQTALTVAVTQMQTILSTIQYWSCEEGSRKNITPTASEEAACLLTASLGNIQNLAAEKFDQTALQTILDTTDFDTVRDNVNHFLRAN